MYTFKGERLVNVSMLPDNNMYQAYYRKDDDKLERLRISAWDLTDGIFNTLKNIDFTIQSQSWGYYRLREQKFFNILGRKLYKK